MSESVAAPAPIVRRQAPAAVRRKRLLIAVADHSILIGIAVCFLAPIVFIGLTSLMTDQQALTPKMWPSPMNIARITRPMDGGKAARSGGGGAGGPSSAGASLAV